MTDNEKPGKMRHLCFRCWVWGVVLVIVLFVAVVRIRLLQAPLERDEGEYAYAGQLILQGIPPYLEAYNMKLPGVYGAYALIMAVFGQTVGGIHLGFLLVNIATVVLVFLLSRRLFGDPAGVAAAASFALLSISPSVLGTSAHATHFVLLPAMGGIILLLKGIESGRIGTLAWSGLLLGLAFVMKQQGVFFPIFGLLHLIWSKLRARPARAGDVAAGSIAFSLAAAVPYGATCLLLYLAGVFDRFWFWTVTYAREYVSQLPLETGIEVFKKSMIGVIGPSTLLWVLAGAGLLLLLADRKAGDSRAFVMGFLAFSFISVCPGLYFRNHYFVTLLPAVALLSGASVSSGMRLLSRSGVPRIVRSLPPLLLIAAICLSLIGQRDFLFRMSPTEASRMMYGWNPFVESLEIADYIKSHTSEGDTIAVMGSEPQIYFYSGRHSATGYIYTYSLMERQKNALKMQREMIGEIEAAQPKYLVLVNIPTSWLTRPGSEMHIIRWTERYSSTYYDEVGVVSMDDPQGTEFYWDEDVAEAPDPVIGVYIYKRRAF